MAPARASGHAVSGVYRGRERRPEVTAVQLKRKIRNIQVSLNERIGK
jgi:hypothetical protein